MKKQSTRLQPVVDFNQRKESDAAKELAQASSEVAAQKQRLIEFEAYRSEYGQQFAQAGSGGLNAARVRDFQAFINKLNHVVEQQKVAIKNAEREYEAKKRQWLAARNKLKAINKVQEKHIHSEAIAEEKKQQKEQDDRNSRRQNGQ